MRTVSVFVCWVFTALVFLSGCQSDPPKQEVEVEGQVFVVTEGRENIKMGLTPIHLISDEEFRKIAPEVASRAKDHRLENIQRKANYDAREELIDELMALEAKNSDLNVPSLDSLRESIAPPIAEQLVSNRSSYDSFGFSKKVLFSLLPPAVTKTDADGRFKISLKSKSWVIAKGERSVGKERERYLWILPIEETQKNSSLLVSNDSGFDSLEELFRLVNSASEKEAEILPSLESGKVDEETSQRINEVRLKAGKAITSAQVERMAKLNAARAAKATQAKRMATLKAARAAEAAKASKAAEAAEAAKTDRMAKFKAAGASLSDEEIVALMKKSIKGGAVKEFTMAQVKGWRANGEEIYDGTTYQTGLATYEAQTIFGLKPVSAKALFKHGELDRWLFAKSGMEIE